MFVPNYSCVQPQFACPSSCQWSISVLFYKQDLGSLNCSPRQSDLQPWFAIAWSIRTFQISFIVCRQWMSLPQYINIIETHHLNFLHMLSEFIRFCSDICHVTKLNCTENRDRALEKLDSRLVHDDVEMESGGILLLLSAPRAWWHLWWIWLNTVPQVARNLCAAFHIIKIWTKFILRLIQKNSKISNKLIVNNYYRCSIYICGWSNHSERPRLERQNDDRVESDGSE